MKTEKKFPKWLQNLFKERGLLTSNAFTVIDFQNPKQQTRKSKTMAKTKAVKKTAKKSAPKKK
jgi:hypothetical protein